MNITVNVSQLRDASQRYRLMAAQIGSLLGTQLIAAQDEVETMAIEEIRLVTPYRTGKLAASTIAESVMRANVLETSIAQPAESEPNEDGSGGHVPYVPWVIGGRGAIKAPSAGPYSTGKKALRTPWGPRKSVRASKPNPYPLLAEQPMATALTLIADRIGEDVLTQLVKG